MHFNKPFRMHRRALPQPRDKRVDRPESDEGNPAHGPGVDMTNGPIGIVGKRIDLMNGHERPFEGGQPIEGGGNHHEAQSRIVPNFSPGAVEGQQRIARRSPGRDQEHEGKRHSQGLNPVRKRGIFEVVGPGPHVEEGYAPKADDRRAVRIDRPLGLHWQEIVHHAQEAGSQEKRDGIVAIPPLHHGVLHAGKERVTFCVAEGNRNRQAVHDVQ